MQDFMTWWEGCTNNAVLYIVCNWAELGYIASRRRNPMHWSVNLCIPHKSESSKNYAIVSINRGCHYVHVHVRPTCITIALSKPPKVNSGDASEAEVANSHPPAKMCFLPVTQNVQSLHTAPACR